MNWKGDFGELKSKNARGSMPPDPPPPAPPLKKLAPYVLHTGILVTGKTILQKQP